MRKLLGYAVKRIPGVETQEAGDGLEALAKVAATTPDVMLTDVNMPNLDGLQLIERIRADDRLAAVAIVVITTESANADIERALGLGADAYIPKPVQAPRVVEVVKQLLADGRSVTPSP